jgi:mono/diheme cytochrome c family protein
MADRSGEATSAETAISATTRNRIGLVLLGALFAFLVGAIILAKVQGGKTAADPDDPRQVALGKAIYDQNCGMCHGVRLEGQPNWQEKLPTGRMPAPPHDASGHTWHHPDQLLFGITKYGLVPGKYAPPGYSSDMPAFGGRLTDEQIWAVLAYIKSRWPKEIRAAQAERARDAARR